MTLNVPPGRPLPQVVTVIINLMIWDKHAGPEGIALLAMW